MTTMVDIGEAQTQLVELLSLAMKGDEVIISKDNKPVARLVPVSGTHRPRVAGLNKGKIWMSEDFDEPLPSDFWTGNV